MWNTGAGIVQVASILIALSALALAYLTHKRPPDHITGVLERVGAVEKAFKELEHDAASMWEKVESHLGRISRLKKDMKPNVDEILAQAALAREQRGAPAAAPPSAEIDPDMLYKEWKAANRSTVPWP